jgi:hypothetical protein
MKGLLLALVLAVSSLQALAQSAVLVDGVQMPAWRERGAARVPLVPGMELRAGDRILTGKDARVLLKLSEGSVVKLGENGKLVINELQPATELFRAALQVLEGAFRFTSDVAAKARKRDVKVSIDQVTIGIRGTDVWGRARGERQIVCLLEGAVEVAGPGEAPVRLDQPRQFYRRDKGKTEPVGFVDAKQFQQWATETDIEAGRGALRSDGAFALTLLTSDQQADARGVRDQLRQAGYPAEIARGKDGYTVRIRYLPSREEAQALASRLKGRYGTEEAKISGG